MRDVPLSCELDFIDGKANMRDTLERLFWTAVSAVVAIVPVIVANLPGDDRWWYAPLVVAINWLTIELRKRTEVLPSPGEGLPGLPTAEATNGV